MTISLELDPALEARLNQEARRLGLTESAFIKDMLERTFGFRNPADLLRQVRSNIPMGEPDISENVSAKVRDKLSAQRTD
jgi:predicted DNA-binding protein